MKLWKRILAVAVVAVAAGVLLYFGIGSNRLASLEIYSWRAFCWPCAGGAIVQSVFRAYALFCKG